MFCPFHWCIIANNNKSFQSKITSQDIMIVEQGKTISFLNATANLLNATIASQNLSISELSLLIKSLPDTIRQECEVCVAV
jgi:hypothetical protein